MVYLSSVEGLHDFDLLSDNFVDLCVDEEKADEGEEVEEYDGGNHCDG